jgi:uncharacterized lipoprotein YddW (UPF0748 family)
MFENPNILCLRTISHIILILCFSSAAHGQTASPKREFRGVWVASVSNIDWPSRPGLTSEEQQKEFLNIISLHKANGMNALVVQVRPAADAFYPSRYEPWSKWLTGKLGKPPDPYYDPLQFMIENCHNAGMEFHAWFNPYRCIVNADTTNIDSASIAFGKPEWFVNYGKNIYFDPGIPAAREHVTNVVMDVVNRYDIDAIHFDDYFYPYKIAKLNFPDSASFNKYGNNFSVVDDWRRDNVNQLIKGISDSLRKVKPFVKFGISPFAVWRNQDKDQNGSATRAGQTCYDDLYADVLKWMKEGWIDYVTPQIYWSIGFDRAPYEVIASWWNKNSNNLQIYIGQAAYRINNNNDAQWKDHSQIPKQIRLNRSLANVQGSTFFSSKSFIGNPLGINDSLKTNLYRYPALTPGFKNIPNNASYELRFTTNDDGIIIGWKEPEPENLSNHQRYVIYRFDAKSKIDLTKASSVFNIVSDTNPYATNTQSYVDKTVKNKKKYVYVVTSLNRYQQESAPTFVYSVKKYKKYWRVYPPQNL